MADSLQLSALKIEAGSQTLVTGVDLQLARGEICALVGPSGSGKSLTARAMLGLVEIAPGVTRGTLEVMIDGTIHSPEMTGDSRARRKAFAKVRGAVIGYLPQDAMSALDPLRTVGRQVALTARRAGRDQGPTHWLNLAGLQPSVANRYPHELSGGMAQRVTIAQALARGSHFLLADEPTTGLDPAIRRPLLDELRRVADEGVGVLWITHDLRAITGIANRVLVMSEGQIVESTTPDQLAGGEVESSAARRLIEATRRIAAGRLG
ncbi:MAG: ABC transporter ATP-binding protein [Proteobacteria bacterium]|nr:ABC transporter ATP-binding protein [Pseudomonadota bacterium]